MNYPMKRVRNLRHFVVRRRLAQTYEESLISTYDFKTNFTQELVDKYWCVVCEVLGTGVGCCYC